MKFLGSLEGSSLGLALTAPRIGISRQNTATGSGAQKLQRPPTHDALYVLLVCTCTGPVLGSPNRPTASDYQIFSIAALRPLLKIDRLGLVASPLQSQLAQSLRTISFQWAIDTIDFLHLQLSGR